MVAKFGTASGAIWWPNLKLLQVVLSGSQIWKLLLMLVVPPGGQNWNQSLARIFLSTEFACCVAEEITQV